MQLPLASQPHVGRIISYRSIYQSTYPSVKPVTITFHEFILNRVGEISARTPELKAFISAEDHNDFLTFGSINKNCLSVANYLKNAGFKKGDVCFTIVPNCWQFAVVYLGTSMCGGVISGAKELRELISDAKSRIIFTTDEHLAKTIEAVKDLDYVTDILVVQQNNTKSPPQPSFKLRITNLCDVLATSISTEAGKNPEFSPHDDLMLPFSSGTTGRPKGVQITHQNFGTMVARVDSHLQNYVYTAVNPQWHASVPGNALLNLPLHHIYGVGCLFLNIIQARTCVTMLKFDPISFFKVIEKYRIEHLKLVPPIIICLAKHPEALNYDLSSMQSIISGAAPLSKETVQLLLKRFPNLKFLGNGFGLTECGMAACIAEPRSGETAYFSVGKLLPNFEAKIIDPETRKEVPKGQTGEILRRSDTNMKGYLNNPQATSETIRDGWLYTGDVAYEKDDHFYIVDRIKELIKVKGYQVSPAELEDLLLSHSDVADCAVIGIPDEKSGEVPKAFVVLKAHSKLSAEEIQKFVSDQVASYKQLKGGVAFTTQIPRSASGKILRRQLSQA